MPFFYVLNEPVLNKQFCREKIDKTIIAEVERVFATDELTSVSITDFKKEINKQYLAGAARAGTLAAVWVRARAGGATPDAADAAVAAAFVDASVADYVARAINSYDKFESSELIIFEKNDSDLILGACFINLESLYVDKKVIIDMYGENSVKEILLYKVKLIGKPLNANTISISTDNDSERKFYEENGFGDESIQMEQDKSIQTEQLPCSPRVLLANLKEMSRERWREDRDIDDDIEVVKKPNLIYKIHQSSSRGGKRKTTSQKSKRKNKQRKITKKRNRISSKKRKYYRP